MDKIKSLISRDLLDSEIVHRRRLKSYTSSEKIVEAVAGAYGVQPGAVTSRGGRNNIPKRVALYLTRRHAGLGNAEIGRIFGGLSDSAVSKAVSRVEKEMVHDCSLRTVIDRLESNVKA